MPAALTVAAGAGVEDALTADSTLVALQSLFSKFFPCPCCAFCCASHAALPAAIDAYDC
jgi:hypothetical protein